MTKNKEGVVFGNTYTRTFSRSEVLLTQNNAEHILFYGACPSAISVIACRYQYLCFCLIAPKMVVLEWPKCIYVVSLYVCTLHTKDARCRVRFEEKSFILTRV